jgi:hypothetical protein
MVVFLGEVLAMATINYSTLSIKFLKLINIIPQSA